jgi:aquaporin Z
MVSEFVLSAMFVIVIHGATDRRAPAGFGPLAIGLTLTVIHLISIPVTNTSVNPARSTGVALFQGTWAIQQLWMFWLVPLIGGAVGGLVFKLLLAENTSTKS